MLNFLSTIPNLKTFGKFMFSKYGKSNTYFLTHLEEHRKRRQVWRERRRSMETLSSTTNKWRSSGWWSQKIRLGSKSTFFLLNFLLDESNQKQNPASGCCSIKDHFGVPLPEAAKNIDPIQHTHLTQIA